MTGLEEKHSVISKEDMQSAMDFVEDFSHELEKYPHRIAASKDETACARAIRNRLHDETDAKTRLEAFDASPLLGRGSFLLIGIWYAICYVMYFVSFAGGRVTGAMLTLLSLAMFLGGGSVFLLMYLGNSKLGKVLPKKVSYNVVSESCNDAKKCQKRSHRLRQSRRNARQSRQGFQSCQKTLHDCRAGVSVYFHSVLHLEDGNRH